MRFPSADELIYFQEVARRGSMSRAAEALGLRQSTLSTAIKRLEKALGVTLFVRGKVGAQLTAEGKVLQQEAKEFQRRWVDIQTKVRLSRASVAGRFVIGTHPSAGLLVLPGVVKRLAVAHPNVDVEIVTNYSGSVIEEVRARRVDFGISASPNVTLDVDDLPIMSAEIRLWIAANVTLTPDMPLIYDPQTIGLPTILRKIQSSRIAFSRLMQVGDLEIVAELTRCGVGAGILPDVVAGRRPDMPLANIHKTLFYRSPLGLYYRSETGASPGGRAIIEAFKKERR